MHAASHRSLQLPLLGENPVCHLPRHLSWHRGQRTPMPCMRCSDGRQEESGSRGLPETSAPQDCSWTRRLTWERPGTRPLGRPTCLSQTLQVHFRLLHWSASSWHGVSTVLLVMGTSCAWHCFPAHESFLPTYGNKRRALSRAGTKDGRGSAPRMRLSRLLSSPFSNFCAPGPQGRDRPSAGGSGGQWHIPGRPVGATLPGRP